MSFKYMSLDRFFDHQISSSKLAPGIIKHETLMRRTLPLPKSIPLGQLKWVSFKLFIYYFILKKYYFKF